MLHHNDADGICSGYILDKVFSKKGYHVKRICLEKPYPKAIEPIHRQEGLIVYADFGSRMSPIISEVNKDKNLVLVLDHHKPVAIKNKSIININPMFHEIRGDREISAAGVSYLFSRTWEQKIAKYAYLALVGGIGDGHIENNSFPGLHQLILAEASENNALSLDTGEEKYYLNNIKDKLFLEEIEETITTLGAFGYYSGGVQKAFDWMNSGYIGKSILDYKEELTKKKNRAFKVLEEELKEGDLKRLEKIQWFDTKWYFHDFGVKTVGLFCSYLKKKDFISKDSYIIGLQPLPPYIPQIGTIPFSDYKVSVRCSAEMEQKIWAGKIPSIADILPEATKKVDGFIDACHSNAGATVIPIASKEKFVKEFNRLAMQ